MFLLKNINNHGVTYMITTRFHIIKRSRVVFFKKYNYKDVLNIALVIFIFLMYRTMTLRDINSFGQIFSVIKVSDLTRILLWITLIAGLFIILFSYLNKKRSIKFDLGRKMIKKNNIEYSFSGKYVCIKEKKSDDGSSYLLTIVSSDSFQEIKIISSWNLRKINSMADDIATILESKVVKKEFDGPISVFLGW